jgi:FkbM family methyltransferase
MGSHYPQTTSDPSLKRLLSWLRGVVYWLITAGPIGLIAGRLFRHRCFDCFGPIVLPASVSYDIAGAIIFGAYEHPERKLIQQWLPTDLDCIELGCSISVISRIILHKLEATRRVFAVEASETLLDFATRNATAAGFGERFTPIHGAVHYIGEYVNFCEHGEHIRGKVASTSLSDGTPTRCITLAQIVQAYGLKRFSLVMDIEGSEFDLVAKDAYSLINCQALIVEVHGDDIKKSGFVEALSGQGFTLVEVRHAVFAFTRKHAANSFYS